MEYTAKDELLIKEHYDKLLHSCSKIIKNEEELEFIQKAFYTAKDAHKGVRRKSGDPYILHPIAVAQIVVDEIGLGIRSVASALLHDVVEDTDFTVDEIRVMFGEKVASMVDGLTKMSGIFTIDTSEQAENFRKMLLTLADDVRVILIKIADRLHNMRTLSSMRHDKQIKISSETKFLFAPLAYRLGLYAIMTELDDLSFRYLQPEEYSEIEHKLKVTEKSRQEFIDEFNAPIIKVLKNSNIDFEISGRVKSIWSIWSKMQRKEIPFEEVYDIFAIRIVFKPAPLIPEKSQTWNIYSLITDLYLPKDARTRDWISRPKANHYEALHATLMGPKGVWVEVQIRSERMEEIAERGYAAHWKYKNVSVDDSDQGGELDKSLDQIRELLSNPNEDAAAFLDAFKMTLYASEIVVFTPKGEAITIKQGATALDFAYAIHTKIGEKAIGAKINQKIESIYTPLTNGDKVEIITSASASPKPEWLNFVVTVKAKQAISSFLRRKKQGLIELGREKIERRLKEEGVDLNNSAYGKIQRYYKIHSREELYRRVGEGSISFEMLLTALYHSDERLFEEGEDPKESDKKERKRKLLVDARDLKFQIATCCRPIPGDQIVGYFNFKTDKIYIHKPTCVEFERLATQFGDQIRSVDWAKPEEDNNSYHQTVINLRGIDRAGMLMDIVQVIDQDFKLSIRELHMHGDNGIFEGYISVFVRNRDELQQILERIGSIEGVDTVRRDGDSIVSLD